MAKGGTTMLFFLNLRLKALLILCYPNDQFPEKMYNFTIVHSKRGTFILALGVRDPELEVQLIRVQALPLETRPFTLLLLIFPIVFLPFLVFVGHPYDSLPLLGTTQMVYGHAITERKNAVVIILHVYSDPNTYPTCYRFKYAKSFEMQ